MPSPSDSSGTGVDQSSRRPWPQRPALLAPPGPPRAPAPERLLWVVLRLSRLTGTFSPPRQDELGG
jgi:hypothetical protein